MIESDQYFSFSNLTYATTPHLGTVGTNYYATTNAYDDRGRLARTVDAVGTITDTVYDSLGRPVSTYVGTNDSTTDDELYTGDNADSSSNMVLVTQDQYDNDGVGDGNLTRETQYPDAIAADARETDYVYDWRDRLVATKSGVQASEDSTTGRPIVFNTLDNLGEVTAVSEYDGDGVALSTTPPAASLLRAYDRHRLRRPGPALPGPAVLGRPDARGAVSSIGADDELLVRPSRRPDRRGRPGRPGHQGPVRRRRAARGRIDHRRRRRLVLGRRRIAERRPRPERRR